jgi:PKD repeat protein
VVGVGCASENGGNVRASSPPGFTTSHDGQAGTGVQEPLHAAFDFVISYDETQTTICPVRTIQFTDQSNGSPQQWMWEFPYGESSTEANPIVTHAMWGTVALTVTRDGQSDQVSRQIATLEC